ncbi:hypothetical protein QBC34DRAFT_166066 [Podospora aff. communis PSN243]|uniref:C2H2-type domain-containing protein n=1 Tax=Podospora aff. communis PSN243 TaxID=3040156 RepID=A0AAV9G8P2_9PEZI|nr:hypothetical protein QBC34DRAFT_166066 [Podospora aff. communis PSN243]
MAEPDSRSPSGGYRSGVGGGHGFTTSSSSASKSKGKSVSKSKADGRSSSKSDDWAEVSDAEERRRIQNRIAQRKFRMKTREQMERAQRDAANETFAPGSYRIGGEAFYREDELSGLPWGGFDTMQMVNWRHQNPPGGGGGFLDQPSPYYSGVKGPAAPKIGYSDLGAQVPEALKSGGQPVDSLAKLASKLSLESKASAQLPIRDHSPKRNRSNVGYSSEAQTTSTETESASSRSCSASPSSSALLSPVLDRNKRNAIDSLMAEFETLLNTTLCQGARARGGQRGSSRSLATGTSALPGSAEASSTASSKRPRDGDRRDDTDPSDSEGGRDGEPKRTKLTPESESQPARRLACHYNRRNPQKHNKHRSCNGPGWSTVHRVKEHIYRTHALPTRCARCGEEFQNEADLTAHQRRPQGCEVREVEQAEGCTKDQEKALRKRTKGLESEEEKWKEMYRILFPDDPEDAIPTPYYDDGDSSWESRRDDEFNRYESYLRRELPRAVRTRLEEAVASFSDPFVRQLRSQLVDIVRDTQAQLFRDYRQTMQARSSTTNDTGPDTAQFDAPGQFSDIFLDLSPFDHPSPISESQAALTSQPAPSASSGQNPYFLSPYAGGYAPATLHQGSQPDPSTSPGYGYPHPYHAQPSDSGYDSSMGSGEKEQDHAYCYDYE